MREIGSGMGQKRSESLDMGKSGLSGQSASQKYEKILNKNPPSSAKALLEEKQNPAESVTQPERQRKMSGSLKQTKVEEFLKKSQLEDQG